MKVSYLFVLTLGFLLLSFSPLSTTERCSEIFIYHDQDNAVKVRGYFNKENKDSLSCRLAHLSVLIRMTVADTVFQTTYIKDNGSFEFRKLAPNQNFKLQYYYLLNEFTPISTIDFQENNLAIVRAEFGLKEFADSVNLNPMKELKIFHVFGHGVIDRRIRILARKYGMRLREEGCAVPPEGEESHNKEALDYLTKIWGNNWYQDVYWREIHSKVFRMHEQ
jgi:hypothetical protein